jgi:hypothetical protein
VTEIIDALSTVNPLASKSHEKVGILQEYRDLQACFEPEYCREAIDRHRARYPAPRPIEAGEFFGLGEEKRKTLWIHLGAEGPLWQVSDCLGWVGSHERTYAMVLAMVGCEPSALAAALHLPQQLEHVRRHPLLLVVARRDAAFRAHAG